MADADTTTTTRAKVAAKATATTLAGATTTTEADTSAGARSFDREEEVRDGWDAAVNVVAEVLGVAGVEPGLAESSDGGTGDTGSNGGTTDEEVAAGEVVATVTVL